jgi:hypothetical protein
MSSSFSIITTSSNYNLEFPVLPKSKSPSTVPIYIKLLSGDLIHLQVTRNISQYDFYEIVYRHLSGLPEYHSIQLINLILYRTFDDGKDNQLLEHISLLLCPKNDEIFPLFIEPFPFYLDFCNEDIRLTDDSINTYVVINLHIRDKTKSYLEDKIFSQDYLLRCPMSQGDLFIPQIWSMDHITVQNMHFSNFGDWGYIDNPDPDLVINDITQLVSDFTRETPYFFMGATHGLHRVSVLNKLLGDDFEQLMKFYISDNNDNSDDDE